MVTSSEAFRAIEARNQAVEALKDLYEKVHRKIVDGRPAEAVEWCAEVITAADAVEGYDVRLFPICAACVGCAEMPNPTESDRKVRCQDMPRVCWGNRYGRMHPVQLQAYVTALVEKRAEKPREDVAPDVPVARAESPTEAHDMRPTPAPPYIYSRAAVIAFNELRATAGEVLRAPIPVPEEDEEVLAHADGTFTVRKIGG